MKLLILIGSFILLMFCSCDNGAQSTDNPASQSVQLPKENPKFPNTKNSAKIPEQRQVGKNIMVESEQKVEEAQVDDAQVDYSVFAGKVCDCARESDALNDQMRKYSESGNSQAFTKMVPQVSAAYEHSAECAKAVANSLNSPFMMNKLVPALKQSCPTFDDKLIWQMFLSIKNR